MAVRRIDADKKNHPAQLMSLTFTPEGVFAADCPKCGGYVLLSDEEAGEGKAQCFGEIILVSW